MMMNQIVAVFFLIAVYIINKKNIIMMIRNMQTMIKYQSLRELRNSIAKDGAWL